LRLAVGTTCETQLCVYSIVLAVFIT
jgi:hypothetical protein